MGMFDYVVCDYKLPVDGAPKEGWQTKDTPAQMLDIYTIRADGTLWSNGAICDITEEVVFYTDTETGWLEFSAKFKHGNLESIEQIKEEL